MNVTVEIARDAEELLRAMLKSEFGVPDETSLGKVPRVHGMRLSSNVVPADRAGRPTGPEGSPAGQPTSVSFRKPGRTVMNEGAAKGILVSTSGYGKSAFEFATNKPLELLP